MLIKCSLSSGKATLKTKYIFPVLISSLLYSVNARSETIAFGPIFEAYLAQNIQPKVPGYAVGIVTNDGNYSISAGVREIGKSAKFDEHTVFRLASVSKTFTSAAVVSLQQPSVNFDSRLVSYLPDLVLSNPAYLKKLTLGHILSQTSGLVPHAYSNLIEDNVPYKRVVNKLRDVDFICAPGSCYSYQNVIYSLAGDALAQAGNTSYERIVEQSLFQALGMSSSSFGLVSLLAEKNSATPHRRNKQTKHWQTAQPQANYYQLSPSAGVNSNLNDMLKWLEAQLGQHPNVLNESDLQNLHTPQIKISRKQAHYARESWRGVSKIGYALGWRTFEFDGQAGFVHHGGWVEGFRVEMVVNRQLNIGMFFVTNSEPGLASDIVPVFIRMVLKHIEERTATNPM